MTHSKKPIISDELIDAISTLIVNFGDGTLIHDYWMDCKIEGMREAVRRTFVLGFNEYMREIEQND